MKTESFFFSFQDYAQVFIFLFLKCNLPKFRYQTKIPIPSLVFYNTKYHKSKLIKSIPQHVTTIKPSCSTMNSLQSPYLTHQLYCQYCHLHSACILRPKQTCERSVNDAKSAHVAQCSAMSPGCFCA